ncbi:MAG TPA: DUF2911 domain-containing protein [Acidobacteriota bacterium]|nr:DUF2911 domain-containing protein [Acidobacteriota bacterium]
MKKVLLLFLLIGSLLMWGCAPGETADESAEEPAGEAMEEGDDEAPPARGMAELTLDGKRIAIDYGRPALEGRDMISQLEVGAAWRMGQNEATVLDTEASLTFGDASIEPGQYRLWAMKTSAQEWVLIVSSDLENYDESNEVARIPFTVGENEAAAEQFTIELQETGANSGTLVATWDMLRLSADFTAE